MSRPFFWLLFFAQMSGQKSFVRHRAFVTFLFIAKFLRQDDAKAEAFQ
jgi:hypothetical protein